MRMAALACLAGLLAQPRVRATRWESVGGGPVSAAFCIDDSASMAYRFEGKTRVEAAKEWARALLNERGRFGEDSEFIVLTSGPGTAAGQAAESSLTSSRAATERRLEAITAESNDSPVGQMIRQADEFLTKAKHPRREIYVFTDSTVRAWRDLTAPPMTMRSNAAVFCVDVGANEDLNTSLTLASVPQHPVPAKAAVAFDLAVRAGANCHGPMRPTVEVRVDDQPRVRCSVPPSNGMATAGLSAGQTVTMPIALPGMPEGLHRITIELAPSDPLPCDNMRYACVQVGQLPQVAVISSDEATDSAGSIVSAMLAPPVLAEDKQRLRLTHLTPAEAETTALGPFRCVFLVDVPGLDARGWRNLTEYARKGGIVVTILGGAIAAERYDAGADVLPALPGEITQLPAPTHLAPTEMTNPLLAPFASPGVDSLSDRGVFRTWTIRRMGEGATVVCPLASGTAGVIERPVGAGRSILLTFSPQRDWSEFAAQAAPMILLLHTIVTTGSPAMDRIAYATAGAAKAVTLPSQVGPAIEVHTSNGKPEGEARRVNALAAEWHISIPTGEPGHVTLASVERGRNTVFVCAVNVADEESDLRRLRGDEIIARFGPGVAMAAQNSSELRQVQRRQRIGLDATIPAGVALLVLLLAESAFANRFYRRVASVRDGGHPREIA